MIYLILVFITSFSFADLLAPEKRVIEIYKNTVSSVVNVANIKVSRSFFYGEVEVPQGTGSGFIWDNKGHVVTNFHVIQGGEIFTINLKNSQKSFEAKVVGVEPNKDIAVLKIKNPPKDLKQISIGTSSDLQVGQMALAIGNPFGLDHSLSKGIISALGRKIMGIGEVSISDMIQTDTAINQGNSGGPLIDSQGNVIGMNTMIYSTTGSNTGLGFAVPIDTIKRVVPQLIEHGKVIKPGLGIGILNENVARQYFGENGVIISYIDPNGAAAKAGLKGVQKDRFGRVYIGDVIVEIAGRKVSNRDEIFQVLEKFKIGDTIEVKALRDSKIVSVSVTLQAL